MFANFVCVCVCGDYGKHSWREIESLGGGGNKGGREERKSLCVCLWNGLRTDSGFANLSEQVGGRGC